MISQCHLLQVLGSKSNRNQSREVLPLDTGQSSAPVAQLVEVEMERQRGAHDEPRQAVLPTLVGQGGGHYPKSGLLHPA